MSLFMTGVFPNCSYCEGYQRSTLRCRMSAWHRQTQTEARHKSSTRHDNSHNHEVKIINHIIIIIIICGLI